MRVSRARRGLLVLVAGIFSLSQNRWGAREMRQSHKTDAVGHVTAGAGSASLSAASPRGAARRRVSSARFFLGAFLTQAHGGTRRASPCCGQPYRMAPPTRPTPSLRPRSPPSSTPPEVCLETMEIDTRRRHGTPPHTRHIRHPRKPGTRRARASMSGVLGACAFTSGGSPGGHPERNQVHTVSPQ